MQVGWCGLAARYRAPLIPEGGHPFDLRRGRFTYPINHPLKMEIYRLMMQASDDTGAWVEYYEKNQPMGTRCRPWESGVNLEAAIDFAGHYRGR